jgi:phenylacetate-CoA ligase
MVRGLLSFERGLAIVGATADDCAHISFPLGVHPVAHLYARAAINHGIGTVWCGAGTNTPSEVQLELIDHLKPTIWLGMASYGLHLANVAESKGFDLRGSSVRKIIVAAEPLSPVKREKLARAWGAEVFDHFGMTEAAWVAGEGAGHRGLHVWSDLYYVEVVDEASGEPVPDGEVGSLVVTPLWNNSMTPFLRWSSGDLVAVTREPAGDKPWSLFPVMRHARRTIGFFKVRGVNINHSELEDLMFLDADVTDFKGEACASSSGLDVLRLSIEAKRGADPEAIAQRIRAGVSRTFETTPELEFLEPGTLGREFEASIKAARFVDKRG